MRILLPWDLQPATRHALDVAAKYAPALGAELIVLHVIAPEPSFVGYEIGPGTVRDQVAAEWRSEHAQLLDSAEALRQQGLSVRAVCRPGPTAATIVAEAERRQVELIVMASHGRGAVLDALLGGVSREVLRQARVPVLMVPATPA